MKISFLYVINFRRDIMTDYSNKVTRLGVTIFEFLSEALGLEPNPSKTWVVLRDFLFWVITIRRAPNQI